MNTEDLITFVSRARKLHRSFPRIVTCAAGDNHYLGAWINTSMPHRKLNSSELGNVARAATFAADLADALEQATRERDEARRKVLDLKSQRTLFQNDAIESLHLKVNSLERDAVHHRREHQLVTEEHGKLKRERDEARSELAKLRLVSDELISVRRELAELRRVHLGESKVES